MNADNKEEILHLMSRMNFDYYFSCPYFQDIPEHIRKNLVEVLPQPRKVPKRFDEYTQEEIDAFPKLWTR